MFPERITLGIPSLAGYELLDALVKARELGFQSVMALPDGPRAEHSLGAFPTLLFYRSTEEQRQRTKNALAPFEHVSIHQAWDDQWRRWVDCAGCFGAEIVTVHSGRRGTGQSPDQFLAERAEQLRSMGDYAGARGVRVGVENEGGCCDDYLGLIAATGHPSVGATLDVGHCAYFDSVLAVADIGERTVRLNKTLCEAVRTLGNKLFSLHVHDVRASDWRDHRCPGSGAVDFRAFFTALKSIGYAGLFEIELEEPEMEAAAARAGEYLRTLCQTLLVSRPNHGF
jgi:sugar phosphate isomerase/epimerase